jgi:hypothetical protein
VTSADVFLVSQIISGAMPAPKNLCCVDVDGSGMVSGADAYLITRIANGLDASPGVCQ